ncbi:glycosyltransferase family 2 protein [bacterium]|nr:MAG: glycosyltransferase family 2 protein [bacterium]
MPDSDLKLSVTICSWNTQEDLRACLASLQDIPDIEVIVCDNNSEDGSPQMVAEEFPWVRLLAQTVNLGFTGGQNLMIEARRAPHVLLLNSDTVVHEGAISSLMEYLEQNPEVGILGPKLLNPDGSLQLSCRRFPNPLAALFRNTPLGKLFPNNKYTREYLMADFQHDRPMEVDWVSGAALLARKELVDKIGGLDPEFFMYCEDVDWCWRAWKAGYKVTYLPSSVITHAIGRSSDKVPNRMIGRFHKSMWRFYRKNMLPEVALPLRPFALLGAGAALGLRAGLFITSNKIDRIKERLRR